MQTASCLAGGQRGTCSWPTMWKRRWPRAPGTACRPPSCYCACCACCDTPAPRGPLPACLPALPLPPASKAASRLAHASLLRSVRQLAATPLKAQVQLGWPRTPPCCRASMQATRRQGVCSLFDGSAPLSPTPLLQTRALSPFRLQPRGAAVGGGAVPRWQAGGTGTAVHRRDTVLRHAGPNCRQQRCGPQPAGRAGGGRGGGCRRRQRRRAGGCGGRPWSRAAASCQRRVAGLREGRGRHAARAVAGSHRRDRRGRPGSLQPRPRGGSSGSAWPGRPIPP